VVEFDSAAMCDECVGDSALKAFIRATADAMTCSFCGRSSSQPIAADADAVVGEVESCLDQEYEDAAEMVPVEGGEYVFGFKSTREVLEDELDVEETNEAAFDYIVAHVSDKGWVQKNFFSLHPYDVLTHGWEEFAEAIKHRTRYLFFPPRPKAQWPTDNESIRPEDMLDRLGRLIRGTRLVKRLRAGRKLYRVRPHDAAISPSTLSELGPPPADRAIRSNRMSPAGISMLYAATSAETAIAESIDPKTGRLHGTLATLRLETDIRVVDFVRLPASPTIFAPDTTPDERAALHFVHAFAREISRPIERDDREHIEYVPTQVVTEYLRYRFRTRRGPVQGLRYASARRELGANIALFVSYNDIEPPEFTEPESPVRLSLVAHEPISIP
jgi:hypothetical protein